MNDIYERFIFSTFRKGQLSLQMIGDLSVALLNVLV